MPNIKALLNRRESLKAEHSAARDVLNAELQALHNAQFDDWKSLQDALTALESSEEYGAGECDIYRWVRFDDMPSKDDASLEFLEAYLSERCVHADTENGALMAFEGDCIVINDDGDVFEGHKCIIDSRNCKVDGEYSEAKAAYLIEQYMERTGFFPAVLHQTRHGDLFPRNTQELAKGYKPESELPCACGCGGTDGCSAFETEGE